MKTRQENRKVLVIRDTVSRENFDVPQGSVLQQVREFAHCYRGLWCSMDGSYFVTVPKLDCSPVGACAPDLERVDV